MRRTRKTKSLMKSSTTTHKREQRLFKETSDDKILQQKLKTDTLWGLHLDIPEFRQQTFLQRRENAACSESSGPLTEWSSVNEIRTRLRAAAVWHLTQSAGLCTSSCAQKNFIYLNMYVRVWRNHHRGAETWVTSRPLNQTHRELF